MATNEWKKVKPNQAIPPGLHVRINIQTGEREAKLLDKTEETAKKNDDQKSISGFSKEFEESLLKLNDEEFLKNLRSSKDSEVTFTWTQI